MPVSEQADPLYVSYSPVCLAIWATTQQLHHMEQHTSSQPMHFSSGMEYFALIFSRVFINAKMDQIVNVTPPRNFIAGTERESDRKLWAAILMQTKHYNNTTSLIVLTPSRNIHVVHWPLGNFKSNREDSVREEKSKDDLEGVLRGSIVRYFSEPIESHSLHNLPHTDCSSYCKIGGIRFLNTFNTSSSKEQK